MNINIMITAVLNTLLAVLIYVAEKKSFFGKLSYKKRQLIIGILFGIMAAYASTNIVYELVKTVQELIDSESEIIVWEEE